MVKFQAQSMFHVEYVNSINNNKMSNFHKIYTVFYATLLNTFLRLVSKTIVTQNFEIGTGSVRTVGLK